MKYLILSAILASVVKAAVAAELYRRWPAYPEALDPATPLWADDHLLRSAHPMAWRSHLLFEGLPRHARARGERRR